MISRLHDQRHLHHFSAELERANKYNMACIRHIQSLPLSGNERLALLASFAYCKHMTSDRDSAAMISGFVQVTCRALMSATLFGCHPALMVWTAMMLRAVYGPDNMSCGFSDRLMEKIKEDEPERAERKFEGLDDFFWDKSLSVALRDSFQSQELLPKKEIEN